MANRPLKVGFDLDGVILYNPVRVFRPITSFLSKHIFKKKRTSFYIPRSPLEKFAWFVLHKTSFMPAPGLKQLQELVDKGIVEAYLVTGRYASLEKDFHKWMNKINASKLFKEHVYNQKSQQPHIFKKKMIEDLGLDVFVEDNWDIVQQLKVQSEKLKVKPKIFWITNFLDRNIFHEHKFPNLRSVLKHLEKNS